MIFLSALRVNALAGVGKYAKVQQIEEGSIVVMLLLVGSSLITLTSLGTGFYAYNNNIGNFDFEKLQAIITTVAVGAGSGVGMGVGTSIGYIGGPVGTLVGAGVGTIVGGIGGYFAGQEIAGKFRPVSPSSIIYHPDTGEAEVYF